MIREFVNRILVGFILVVILGGCDLSSLVKMKDVGSDDPSAEQPIARVHENYLYPSDLEGIVPMGILPQDSSDLIQRYIDNWVRKQLLIAEAAKMMEFDEVEIERKILDYRYSLMGYEYESYFVNENLNDEVTSEEITDYYSTNQENFELKQNIIQGLFIKVSKGAPKLSDLRGWINSNKQEDRDELKSYCLRFATSYSLEDSTWINFDEMIKGTPLEGISNKVDYLRRNKYEESSDDDYYYFIRIDDYKIKDQISPVEFVADQIRNILINKRKIELAKSLEERVYSDAIQKKYFEVYN